VPLASIVCMLNVDMAGHLQEGKLYSQGGNSAPEFDQLVDGLPQRHGITLAPDKSGLGGSDFLSFIRSGIPAVFYFTGPFPTYHTPKDTAESLDYDGLTQVTAFITDIGAALLAYDGAFTFKQPAGMPPAEAPKGERKVSMGTVPDFEGGDQPGYLVGDVTPGGAAEQAGMKKGDLITKVGDRVIGNIHDYVFALQDLNPGQVVTVVALRDGKEMTFSVTLQARNVEK
jgi:hypothetical protein